MPQIAAFAGRLGSSPQALADALDLRARLDKELTRLYVYASMTADQDTRLSEPQGMQQEMQQLHAEFSAQASYMQPEILRIGGPAIEGFIAAEPRLATHAFPLRDVIRRAAHTLTDAEEKILADAQPLAGSAPNIYGILANADFPYPTITISDGRAVKLDQAGYAELRTLPNRADRELAMSTFFNALGGFRRTFGTTMNSSIQRALFYSKTRKYASTLEASLDRLQHPAVGVHAPDRGRAPPPADVPPLSAAAEADAGDRRRSALLRSLCAAGRVGESALHARRSAAPRRQRDARRWEPTTCRC